MGLRLMPSKNSLRNVKNDVHPVFDADPVNKKSTKPKAQRITKGFQVEVERAQKWDLLVGMMKGASNKKTGPELIDEALDYLFDKYLSN